MRYNLFPIVMMSLVGDMWSCDQNGSRQC